MTGESIIVQKLATTSDNICPFARILQEARAVLHGGTGNSNRAGHGGIYECGSEGADRNGSAETKGEAESGKEMNVLIIVLLILVCAALLGPESTSLTKVNFTATGQHGLFLL